jgi:hypothetical protein
MTTARASIAKVIAGLLEKKMVAAIATKALMIANGGAETATIERTKKPVVIAKVTNEGSLSARLPASTLEIAQRPPIAAR